MFKFGLQGVSKPGSVDDSAAAQDAFSKNEGRKLLVMAVLLLISIFYVGKLILPKQIEQEAKEIGRGLPDQVLIQLQQRAGAVEEEPVPFKEDQGLVEGIVDFQQDVLEDDTLYYYLHKMTTETPESLAAKVEPMPYQGFADDDKRKALRGKVRRINGRIVDYWQRVLERYPNDAKLAWVWQAYVESEDGHFMVIMTDKKIEPAVGRFIGDAVSVDAMFVKGYQYTPRDEKKRRGAIRVPLFMGRDFKIIRTRTYEEAYPYPIAYAMVVVSAGVFVILVFALLYFRRNDRDFEAQHRSMRRRRFQRKNKSPDPAAAKDAAAAESPPSPETLPADGVAEAAEATAEDKPAAEESPAVEAPTAEAPAEEPAEAPGADEAPKGEGA